MKLTGPPRRVTRILASLLVLMQQLVFLPGSRNSAAWAADGGVVVGGQAQIVQNGLNTNITSQSDRTIINWNSFNIPQGHTTNFVQPGANSAVLNRVITPNNPSSIFGTLNSNGNVFLVNPSGVLVGPSGVINTNGFTASVLDISNSDFLNGNLLNFQGDSRASIVNQGKIYTGSGGTTLIGGTVINEGLIESSGGNINLLTGGTVRLRDGGVYTQADQATVMNGISETSGLIKNDGTLRATGALEVGGEVYLVSPGGTVIEQALIAAQKKDSHGNTNGGTVVVDAGSGTATVTGKIDVQGQTGGTVTVTGNEVNLQGADINASGVDGGGEIYIGGGFQGNDPNIRNSEFTLVDADSLLQANAELSGDGGTVIIWSDGWTDYFGSITNTGSAIGRGGFTEVSGKNVLVFGGNVNTGGGILLLDPTNYSIEAGNGVGPNFAGVDALINTINNSGLTVINTNGSGPENGNFTINADLIYNTSNNLALFAHGDMIFNASVQNSGSGNMTFVAGWDGTSSTFSLSQYINADPNTTTLYGNNNGSIYIGSASQATGVAVGSRHGQTNVYGHNLILRGSDTAPAYAQLGFHDVTGQGLAANSTITTGPINIGLTGNLQAQAGSQGSFSSGVTSSYVQVGHGGNRRESANSPTPWNYQGDITLAGQDITFAAGNGTYAYAQLGQGGASANGSHSGTTTITTARDITFTAAGVDYAYAQFGQGGAFANGNHSGTTTITTANDITFTAGSGFAAYAQLGQGGSAINGNHSGITTITTANNLTFTAGGGNSAYAQLGQGGVFADGSHSGGIDITLNGNLTLTGANSTSRYSLIGHGDDPGDGDSGHSVSGDINLRVGNNATLSNAYVGHLIDANGTYTQGQRAL